MRIAIAEDDVELSRYVGEFLRSAGHIVEEFKDGALMIKQLKRESFDALLLDWQMPGNTGLEVLNWIRQNLDPAPPVIMVTSRIAEADIVAALNAGADDFVTKPVQPAVLAARLAAVTRRVYPQSERQAVENFGDYVFDNRRASVTVKGVAIDVTAKEYALALQLFRNTHRPMSRGHLLESVWGHGTDLATRTLDVHISQIRNRLQMRPENGLRLSSIYGFGYRREWIGDGSDGDED